MKNIPADLSTPPGLGVMMRKLELQFSCEKFKEEFLCAENILPYHGGQSSDLSQLITTGLTLQLTFTIGSVEISLSTYTRHEQISANITSCGGGYISGVHHNGVVGILMFL